MKALVYHGPGLRSYEEKPMPVVKESTDAVVKITKTTICGTDLEIMKGDVPDQEAFGIADLGGRIPKAERVENDSLGG